MTKAHHWRPAALLLLAALSLGGCAGPVSTDALEDVPSTGTSTPTSPTPTPPAPSETATPSPEPTVPAVTYDRIPSRVPLTCDELVPPAAAGAAINIPAEQVTPFDNPLADGSAAQLQAGVLDCNWRGVEDAEANYQFMKISVLPDATKNFRDFVKAFASDRENSGLLGKSSYLDCTISEDQRSCSGAFVVDGYWVEFDSTGPAPTEEDKPEYAAALALGTVIQGTLGTAGPPLAAFEVPQGSAPLWDSCSALDANKKFRKKLKSTGLTAPEQDNNEGPFVLFTVAWNRADFGSCVWRHDDTYSTPTGQVRQTSVWILPGGGWAWEELRDGDLARPGAELVAIDGADEAVVYCNDDVTGCSIIALVDGSFVSFDVDYDDPDGGLGAEAAVRAGANFLFPRIVAG